MDLAPVATVASPVLLLAAQAAQRRFGRSPERRQLSADIELYDKLPDASTSKAELLRHIDLSVIAVIKNESTRRRNPVGITLALFFLVGATSCVYYAATAKSWNWTWALWAGVTDVFGITGLALEFPKRERDEKGRALKKSAS